MKRNKTFEESGLIAGDFQRLPDDLTQGRTLGLQCCKRAAMSYRLCLVLAALTATACGSSDSTGAAGGKMSPTPIQTSFDADIEGWSLQSFNTDTPDYTVNPDLASVVTWDATGGNPGGSITRGDFIGESDYFQTPAAFHGDPLGLLRRHAGLRRPRLVGRRSVRRAPGDPPGGRQDVAV